MSYSEQDGNVVLTMSREDADKLFGALKAQQIVIHAGQFHQWASLAICRERGCMRTKDLLDRLNEGNPNYTPYQVKS